MIASDIDCGMTLDELEEATDELVRRNAPLYPPDVDFTIVHNVSPGVFALYADVAPEAGQPTVAIHTWPLIPYIGPMADWFDTACTPTCRGSMRSPGACSTPRSRAARGCTTGWRSTRPSGTAPTPGRCWSTRTAT